MKNKIIAKLSTFWLFLVICLLMFVANINSLAQNSSISVDLEGTQWQGANISQANVDGSITVLSRTYTFESNGIVSLTIFISKGVGVETIGTPFGDIPYSKHTKTFGTYKVTGKSISIDLPDRKIEAIISGDTMKGTLTAKENDNKEEWLVVKFIPENTEAIKSTPKLSPMTSQQVDVMMNQIGRLLGENNYKEVIQKLDILIDNFPNNYRFYALRGEAKFNFKDYKGAIQDSSKVISNSNNRTDLMIAYFARGSSEFELFNYQKALLDYNQYIKWFEDNDKSSKSPNSPVDANQLRNFCCIGTAYKNRAISKFKLGDSVGACKDFQEASKLGDKDSQKMVETLCK